MEDQQARELLEALAGYFEDYGADSPSPRELTVSELAGDLVDSLPRGIARDVPRAAILEPDSMAPEYRTRPDGPETATGGLIGQEPY